MEQTVLLGADGRSYTTQLIVEANSTALTLKLPGSVIPESMRFLHTDTISDDSTEQNIDNQGRLTLRNRVLLLRYEHQYNDEIDITLQQSDQQQVFQLKLTQSSIIETPEKLDLTTIAWVFPPGFVINSYTSEDTKASWSLDRNTLRYASSAADGSTLSISYSRSLQELPDSDQDGLADNFDECPNTGSGLLVDAAGCALDFDSDGVPNNFDQCPDTREGVKVDTDGCEPDDDRDGVVNAQDLCANSNDVEIVDQTGCALDTDKDNIPDYRDTCPTQKFPTEITSPDFWGCQIEGSLLLGEIHFKTGSSNLNLQAREILEKIAKAMLHHGQQRFEVSAHTDSTGLPQNNQSLSERRATVVRHFLMLRGVPPVRLDARGYGEDKPIADNSTNNGRKRNRRIEITPVD